MHIDETSRNNRILDLPIRPQLKQLISGQLDVGPFREYFQQPSKFYAQGWPDNPANWPTFSGRQLLPLWEHYQMIFALDLSKQPHDCLQFYAESPGEYAVHSSVDEGVFEMIRRYVWEYGGDEEEAADAMEFAKQLDFPNLDELSTLLSEPSRTTDEMIDGFRRSLAANPTQ
jgi:hypothetical protein